MVPDADPSVSQVANRINEEKEGGRSRGLTSLDMLCTLLRPYLYITVYYGVVRFIIWAIFSGRPPMEPGWPPLCQDDIRMDVRRPRRAHDGLAGT